jgi:hypothetical protein
MKKMKSRTFNQKKPDFSSKSLTLFRKKPAKKQDKKMCLFSILYIIW